MKRGRGTVCGNCDKPIKPCEWCCGRSGWRHRETDAHACDPEQEHNYHHFDNQKRPPQAFPFRRDA